MTRTILLAVALGIAMASVSTAQAAPPLTAGSRIRIKTQDTTRILSLVGLTSDSIAVRQAADAAPEMLPLSQVRRLEVSRGMRTPPQGARQGLGYGILIGGGVGMVMGLAAGDDEGDLIAFTAEEKGMFWGLALGALGGVVGAFAGAAAPGESWQRVSIANARVSFVPQRSGRLALTIAGRW